jgi:ABC-type Fe3+ transport system substrate-binding protein
MEQAARMRRFCGASVSILLLAACKASSPGQPVAPPVSVRVASDLPGPVIETALRNVAQSGGPRAEVVKAQAPGANALQTPAAVPDAGLPPATDNAAARAAVATSLPADAGATVPPADIDVRWNSEPYGAIAAAQRGELLPMPQTAQDVPNLWRDPGGTWVAVGGRAEVLLVALGPLGDHPEPVSFTALTEPWLKGKVAIAAPIGGASLAHFAALYQAWGTERMEAWLSRLERNDVQVLDDDDAVRRAVVSGNAIVGILASDEAAKAAASAARVDVVYPNQRSIGTFVWPTALSLPKSAPHPAEARGVAEKLADKGTEQLLVARAPGFIPLRAGIPVPPGVTGAPNLVVVSVNPAAIVSEIGQRRAQLAAWTERMRRRPTASTRQ